MSRINTNVSALQSIHQLNTNQGELSSSLERLSTGLRINRGADDPAGLIASESLRSEIRGLEAAIGNSERAINVISTADAALGEVSKLLLEIKGLVVQTANDGALSDDEIQANQQQVDSLLQSIDRIANSTQFNGKKLLNGQLSYTIDGQSATAMPRVQVFGARVPAGGTLNVDVQVTQSAQTAAMTIGTGGTTGITAGGAVACRHAIKRGLLTPGKSKRAEQATPDSAEVLTGPRDRASVDQACASGVATKRKLDRTLACVGKLVEAEPEFAAVEAVAGAGVLLALPALLHEGLCDVGGEIYGKLRNGFFGLRSVLLTLAFMALLRIKTSEQLTEHTPGELGILLGLARAPEGATLRRQLRGRHEKGSSG